MGRCRKYFHLKKLESVHWPLSCDLELPFLCLLWNLLRTEKVWGQVFTSASQLQCWAAGILLLRAHRVSACVSDIANSICGVPLQQIGGLLLSLFLSLSLPLFLSFTHSLSPSPSLPFSMTLRWCVLMSAEWIHS